MRGGGRFDELRVGCVHAFAACAREPCLGVPFTFRMFRGIAGEGQSAGPPVGQIAAEGAEGFQNDVVPCEILKFGDEPQAAAGLGPRGFRQYLQQSRRDGERGWWRHDVLPVSRQPGMPRGCAYVLAPYSFADWQMSQSRRAVSGSVAAPD